MTAVQLIGRLVMFALSQPGARDFLSSVTQRVVKQATTSLIHALNQGTKTRKTVQTMR